MNANLRKTRNLLAVACMTLPGAAAALPFEFGEIEGNFDTTVSLGASWRMQDRSSSLVGIANGGSSRSVNDDDGNLNYDRHDIISGAIKATHDLAMKRGDSGLFTRFTYFYDVAVDEDVFPLFYNQDNTTRDTLGGAAEDRLISDLELLDLFAYTEFDAGDTHVSLRAGNQVINWGESTFIGNSINTINPVDVAKLRTPGAEVKEALKPTPMIWTTFDIGDAVKVEALWMSEFEQTELDPRGAFFSTNDFISDDGDRVFAGFARRNDQHQPYAPPATQGPPDENGNPTVVPNPTAQVWLPRQTKPEIDHERGQYGVALRYYAEELNETEFGLFYLNYHSRAPLVSVVRGATSSVLSQTPTCAESAEAGCRATYFEEYPEDIELYGLSFNTSAPYGIALQGEYSFRRNQPVQIAAVEVLLASLGAPNTVTGQGVVDADNDPATPDVPVAATVAPGTVIRGYERVNVHQIQATMTKAFGPSFGASQFALVGEAGYNYQDLPDGQVFSAGGTSLPAPGSANAAGGSFQQEGYATRSSWGYRLVSRLDFENVIDALQMSPRLVFAHDVNGVGPNFNQDTQALQAGIGFNYLQRWQADLGYTIFTGGRYYTGTDPNPAPAGQPQEFSISANPNRDRDFLSVSLSYAF